MEELERSLEFPTYFSNQFEVQEADGSISIYKAEAFRLYMDCSDNIRGGAFIIKYKKRTVNKKKGWLSKFFNPKPVSNEEIWSFCTDRFEYFIYLGQTKDERDKGYSSSLIGAAANQKIVLTRKLLDLAFGPIDAKIKKHYDLFRQYL